MITKTRNKKEFITVKLLSKYKRNNTKDSETHAPLLSRQRSNEDEK